MAHPPLNEFVKFGKKILGAGINYRSLIASRNLPTPKEPIIFLKCSTSYITEGQSIVVPQSFQVNQEVELGIVIGKVGKHISENEAFEYVGGYCLALDMTESRQMERSRKEGLPWTLGKAFDTACPVSRFISKTELPNPEDVRIFSKVNNKVEQVNNTKFVIMDVTTRSLKDLAKEKFNDEELSSITSEEQVKVENSVNKLFEVFENIPLQLIRAKHSVFLKTALFHVTSSYQCLDAGRPWLCYWILHSLDLLDNTLESQDISKVAQFLKRCESPDGGFGGGPGQFPHLAPTYAAVNALCILGTEEAYNVINREKLLEFLWRLRQPDGSFEMHEGGEVDMRGIYCAVSIAKLTNIYSDELFHNSAEWIASCQTYEGGFAGCPEMEAHGGYAFCGLAALVLLNKQRLLNIKSFLRWVVNRQMRFEGGFQGRTNKLVDGCYSFWQGGVFPIIHGILSQSDEENIVDHDRWMFHQEALQEYILMCCQNSSGGLIDKPKKPRDFYHTCYALSGLSVAQHSEKKRVVLGCEGNELSAIHPLYNIEVETVSAALQYFQKQPVPVLKQIPCRV